VNAYAETKAMGEALVRTYEGPWVIVRPRAVFGPGDTVLFPRILAAAAVDGCRFHQRRPARPGDLIISIR
jgi:nucleoside-diphosphate-sugar epimerase